MKTSKSTHTFSMLCGILTVEGTTHDEILFLVFEDGKRYLASSTGVGQYSRPLRLVIHKQEPALLSSVISSNVPVSLADCQKQVQTTTSQFHKDDIHKKVTIFGLISFFSNQLWTRKKPIRVLKKYI